jgi:hypothetical protein
MLRSSKRPDIKEEHCFYPTIEARMFAGQLFELKNVTTNQKTVLAAHRGMFKKRRGWCRMCTRDFFVSLRQSNWVTKNEDI